VAGLAKPSGAPSERADAIVSAAAACFERWGVVRTRMEDIAREAGISRPALYQHFSGKDALLLEVILRHIESRGELLHEALPRKGPAGPLLLKALMWGVTASEGQAVVERILGVDVVHETAKLIAESDRVADALSAYWRPYVEHAKATGVLRKGVDVDRAVRWLTLIRFSFLSLPELAPAEHEMESYLRTFVVRALVDA
jgi:AcrR family transcriptional regulator